MAGCKTDFVCTLSIKFKSAFLHAQCDFFTITSLYSVIFGNIFEWTKIKKTDELVEILFRNYLACEFTAHYACRNVHLNLTLVTGMTTRFIFQNNNHFVKSWVYAWPALTGKFFNLKVNFQFSLSPSPNLIHDLGLGYDGNRESTYRWVKNIKF